MGELRRLSIRPAVGFEETLTSYLLRLCVVNKIDFKRMWMYVHGEGVNNKKIKKGSEYRIDYMPYRILDIKKLKGISNLSDSEIEKMTFMPIFDKLSDDILSHGSLYKQVLAKKVEMVRKWCPKCLELNGPIYKRIWQFKQIQTCEIHNNLLISKCSRCQKEQPYLNPHMTFCTCIYCGHSLLDAATEVGYYPHVNYADQKRYFDIWSFLLNPHTNLVKEQNNFKKEQALVMKVLNIAELKEVDLREIENFKHGMLKRLTNQIVGNERVAYITLDHLFSFLRESKISINEFSNHQIPMSYYQKFQKNPIQDLGACQTLWCSAYNSNKLMETIINRDYFFYKKERYTSPSICRGCLIKYGFNCEKKWSRVDDTLSLLKTIKKLLAKGLSSTEIKKSLKTTMTIVHKHIAYLIRFNLITKELMNNIFSKRKFEDKKREFVLIYSKLCTNSKGHPRMDLLFKEARSVYGWSELEFWYHYWDFDVFIKIYFQKEQDEFLPEIEIYRENILKVIEAFESEDRDISLKEIACELNVGELAINRRRLSPIIAAAKERQKRFRAIKKEKQLVSEFLEYIREKEENHENAYLNVVYSNLNISAKTLKNNYPELQQLMSEQINLHNEKVKKLKITKMLDEIKLLLENWQETIPFTNEAIANRIGTSISTLYNIPEIANYIKAKNRGLYIIGESQKIR